MLPGSGASAGGSGHQRTLFAARTLSHLSHNFLLQRPLFEALAGAVHDLYRHPAIRQRAAWIVPDLAILDRESLALLRTVYRHHRASAPRLVVGFDPERLSPQPDSDGLVWEHRGEDLWRMALGLLALPEAQARDLERTQGGSAAPAGPHGVLDPLPENPDIALRAVGEAFESFAFESALRRGLALVRRERAARTLSADQRARVHGWIALSAHNRQFRSLGNRELAHLLIDHLTRALDGQSEAAERSALCYRLAVAYGRRLQQRERGLEWSRRAIDEARRTGDSLPAAEAAILEAWGRNIRSFMFTGTGRLAEAARECELAYRRLDDALENARSPFDSPRAGVREAAFSRSILADNLGAIHQMLGDAAGTRRWKATSDGHNSEVPEVERYEARFWIVAHRRRLELGAARERARRGLEAARREQDALRHYRYAVEVADLGYRLGDAAGALADFEHAERLYLRLGSPPFLTPTRLAAAAAASRCGRASEALARIDGLLSGPTAADPVTRAQALALRGLVSARAGDARRAEEAIDTAIELAVESGERDLLLRVAAAAGRACQLLGRPQDARAAYAQAVEIADARPPDSRDADAPPAGALLAAHLGLLETRDARPEQPAPGQDLEASRSRCLALFEDA
ncbi:MAG: tetratricopeptide repeat protein, partial [Acidobacteriota bacterium]